MSAAAATIQSTPAVDVREKLRGLLRHRPLFLMVSGFLLAATLGITVFWPPTYQSTATILIEQQEIPQDLVRSAVTSFADQRVQIISQRVMTTQNLITLIDRYKLYPDIRYTKPREELLKRMRDDIAMKMISADVIDPRSGVPTHATIAFSVSYKNESPDLALKVADELTTLYLNENLTSRSQRAAQTSTFFSEEADRQQAKILELDRKLSEFKQKNEERLPELSQLNHQISDRTETDLREAENRIGAIDSQKVLLQSQLAQIAPSSTMMSDSGQRILSTEDRLKALKSQLAEYKARYSPEHPDIIKTQREVEGLEREVSSDDNTSDLARRLKVAKDQLVLAQEKYSPDHPDVVQLTRVVSELEKQVAAAPASGARDREHAHADNPAYIQVKGQLDALNVERESVVAKRDELRAKLEEYERRLAQAPAVERTYRELARDLELAQLKYQEIRSKQTEVQVSQNLETEHKGERFTLIDPPLPPEKPISPNRILLLCVGLVLSLGGGLLAAVLRDNFDVSVRGVRDMRALLAVAPLAAIPRIVTRAESERRKRVVRYSWQGAVVGIIALAAAVHFLWRPLDVVWLSLIRRFGV
jgi:uncharacterized protein involved in exopolysaccharide biosynthesis